MMVRTLKIAGCRIFQATYRLLSYLLSWKEPELILGPGSVTALPEAVRARGIAKVLLVTDKGIRGLGLTKSLEEKLGEAGIGFAVYDGVRPNPTVENIEEAKELYLKNNCGALIAFGGGSSMDCAKGAAARVANPGKPMRKMKGMVRVRHRVPPVFAVPTTAGTGSEVTIVTVVTDTAKHEKYAVNDPKLRPRVAVLDPELTTGLPKHITAATGMDALTHAVEAYIGGSNTKKSARCALEAVELVFRNLRTAVENGRDIEARGNMLRASYLAGVAFTRAYVGYAHAIAHALGGLYDIPHGLANAVVLPYVLSYYGETAQKKYARLADAAGVSRGGMSESQKADSFLDAVRALNSAAGIPEHLPQIEEKDIPVIVKRVLREGNPLYPVPKIMDKADCEKVVRAVKG